MMKKQLLAVMLCGALLTGCGATAVPQQNGSSASGSALEQPTVRRVDLDDISFGGCASLSLAGNLAAAKAGDTSYEAASDKTAFAGSSEAAWQRLLDGKLDAVLAYAPSADTAKKLEEQGISLVEVGTDALVFLAGSSPEDDMILDWTKQDILAAYQQDSASGWTGYAAAAGSDSRRMFAAVFGSDATGVTMQSGADTLTAACSHTTGTVCYTTWLSLLQNGKPDDTRMIAVDGMLPGDTAEDGTSYPLTVPYYLAVRPGLEAEEPVMLFYRWLGSDAGREWLASAAVPPAAEEIGESDDMTQAS